MYEPEKVNAEADRIVDQLKALDEFEAADSVYADKRVVEWQSEPATRFWRTARSLLNTEGWEIKAYGDTVSITKEGLTLLIGWRHPGNQWEFGKISYQIVGQFEQDRT